MTGSTLALSLTLFAFAGPAFGWAYFAALRRTADLYASDQARVLPAVLALGRLAAAMVFFGFAARVGALPLLAAFLGFLGARALALRAARRVA